MKKILFALLLIPNLALATSGNFKCYSVDGDELDSSDRIFLEGVNSDLITIKVPYDEIGYGIRKTYKIKFSYESACRNWSEYNCYLDATVMVNISKKAGDSFEMFINSLVDLPSYSNSLGNEWKCRKDE